LLTMVSFTERSKGAYGLKLQMLAAGRQVKRVAMLC
jgi:hypothetical protein